MQEATRMRINACKSVIVILDVGLIDEIFGNKQKYLFSVSLL